MLPAEWKAQSENMDVIVVSGDKDLTQLATDQVTVYITRKGMTDIEKYTPSHIEEKYGLSPLQIIDMKGLMGDASDNIPGVPGVGEKTAIKLLKEYGSVEALYEKIEEMKKSKMNTISRTIFTAVPIPLSIMTNICESSILKKQEQLQKNT